MKPTVCSSSPVSSSVLSLISFFDKSKSAGLLKTERKKVVRRDQAHTRDERRDKRQNNSEKNNSIDEFLKLVNKTKKKYKELMEADFDKERNVQTDQTNPLKITGGDDALREIEKVGNRNYNLVWNVIQSPRDEKHLFHLLYLNCIFLSGIFDEMFMEN